MSVCGPSSAGRQCNSPVAAPVQVPFPSPTSRWLCWACTAWSCGVKLRYPAFPRTGERFLPAGMTGPAPILKTFPLPFFCSARPDTRIRRTLASSRFTYIFLQLLDGMLIYDCKVPCGSRRTAACAWTLRAEIREARPGRSNSRLHWKVPGPFAQTVLMRYEPSSHKHR
jgi:hypothetical protein